ncbi:uncharacterized protein PGTG_11863 [Puccinia graminis f. sp. tritici CRL 75-36-700-3]|uniref:ATP-dependent RNA helicase Ski2/MTR4 C-terminal domain-containing protein n=1 Tax=Puccinia graminis f. sp. tritici (strain CRL 75-36-700-3 / race SCCL) TaxID=418459 RepID=E3KMI2_PUCGT|nr:uncharacterized protein PGTG_11863 [Puccinia graminis f. sp. tritici CRL 75-36-700-3]EFP85507.1 hypothetical protein PGTG_11863 [Puccinia graminis f. sp. tritici CRL 75-36-700-3]
MAVLLVPLMAVEKGHDKHTHAPFAHTLPHSFKTLRGVWYHTPFKIDVQVRTPMACRGISPAGPAGDVGGITLITLTHDQADLGKGRLNLGTVGLVWQWAQGMPFSELMEMSKIQEEETQAGNEQVDRLVTGDLQQGGNTSWKTLVRLYPSQGSVKHVLRLTAIVNSKNSRYCSKWKNKNWNLEYGMLEK